MLFILSSRAGIVMRALMIFQNELARFKSTREGIIH